MQSQPIGRRSMQRGRPPAARTASGCAALMCRSALRKRLTAACLPALPALPAPIWRLLPAVHQAESLPDSHSLHLTISANQQRSWAGAPQLPAAHAHTALCHERVPHNRPPALLPCPATDLRCVPPTAASLACPLAVFLQEDLLSFSLPPPTLRLITVPAIPPAASCPSCSVP